MSRKIHLKKISKKIIYTLAFFIGLSAAIFWGLRMLNTPRGTLLVLQTLSKLSHKSFTYTQAQGKLTNLTLQNLHYQNQQFAVDIGNINFHWQPWDLFLKEKLHIINSDIRNVNIHLFSQPQQAAQPSTWKYWPPRLQIDAFNCEHILLRTAKSKQPILFNKLTLQVKYLRRRHEELNAHLYLPSGNATLQGTIVKNGLRESNLAWQITIPDLSRSSSELHGAFNSQGLLSGTWQKPSIKGELNGVNLSYGKNQLAYLKAKWAFNQLTPNTAFGNLTLQHLTLNNYQINQINLTSSWQTNLLKVKLMPLNIVLPLTDHPQTLTINESSLEARFAKEHVDLKTTLNIANQKPLLATLQISKAHSPTGTLVWRSQNLVFLNIFFPALKNPHGEFAVDYKITNFAYDSILTGSMVLNNFSCKVPALNLNLTNGKLKAVIDRAKITYEALVTSGEGALSITGTTDIHAPGLPTTLKITGDNVLVSNTKVAMIVASPRFIVKAHGDRIDTMGSAIISHAKISPEAYNNAISLPKEVEFVSSESADPATHAPQMELYNKLVLVLGDDVKINVAALKGNLTGTLKMYDTPFSTIASGDLQIKNGTYRLYNQELIIQYGSLHYLDSPISDPDINIRAVRSFRASEQSQGDYWQSQSQNATNFTVGMHIQGRLDQLKTTLFSEPVTLKNTDILSYLVLGQALNQASTSNTSSNIGLLFSAASALNIGGSGKIGSITDQLRTALGLSKFGFESQTIAPTSAESVAAPINLLPNPNTTANTNVNTATALVLGKYLSPRLYLGYSFRLIDQVNILKVSYMLTKSWLIQTDASKAGNGIDLLYRIERD